MRPSSGERVKRRGWGACLVLGTLGLWGGLTTAARAQRDAPALAPPVELAVPPILVAEDVRTVDWAPKGDWIAFDRPGPEGYSQLWVARPDGSRERCLTCDHWDLRRRHSGSPTFHPSGDHLVFVVEEPVRSDGRPLPFLSVPGGNLGSDLWAVSFDGRDVFNLTNRAARGGRALAPRFSWEGEQLVWSERLASGGGAWGQWSLQVAEFTVRRQVPGLRRPQRFRPGSQKRYYESYGFTPDDRGVVFAANLDEGQPEGSLDLFVLRLESGVVQRLTTSRSLERFARLSPDGRLLAWASSRGMRDAEPVFERREKTTDTALDLWLMGTDGSLPQRLTRFNDPTSIDYYGQVMAGTPAWSRDGRRLLVPLVPVGPSGGGGLYLLELEPAPLGRAPSPPPGGAP